MCMHVQITIIINRHFASVVKKLIKNDCLPSSDGTHNLSIVLVFDA